MIGMPTQVLLQELERLDIKPISGASIDYGQHYVFKRTDIDRHDLRNIMALSFWKVRERRQRNSVDVCEAASILAVHEKTISDLVSRDVLKPYRDSVSSRNGS